jgi:hypothetical protein
MNTNIEKIRVIDPTTLKEVIMTLAHESQTVVDGDSVEMIVVLAMTPAQRLDLIYMINSLLKQKVSKKLIMINVLHDLNGLKAAHMNLPSGVCFLPRSFGYHKQEKHFNERTLMNTNDVPKPQAMRHEHWCAWPYEDCTCNGGYSANEDDKENQ